MIAGRVASGRTGMVLAVLLGACGAERPLSSDEGAASEAAPRVMGQPDARSSLAALFERHRLSFAPARTVALLGGARPHAELDVAVPARASAGLRVSEPLSGVAASVELIGARDVPGEADGDFVLYRHATAEGAAIVTRKTPSGVEDYVELLGTPPGGTVDYELRLEAGVGLRLIDDTLELVDPSGTPRVRVSPPYLVGADGAVARAGLSVQGCELDRNPAEPWGRAVVAPGAESCRLSVHVNANGVNYPALLDPAWNSAGSLATARTGAQAIVLKTGRVLVAGGRGSDGVALSSAELYNPNSRSWASTASLGTARAEFALALRPTGQALAVGGRDANQEPSPSSELYDATAGTWTSAPSLAVPHADHRAVVLTTGDVLVAGGTTPVAEKFSLATSEWKPAGTLVAASSGHTLTVLPNGKVLLVGGAQAQSYEPSTDHWYPTTGASGAVRAGHTTTRLTSGQLLVVDDLTPSTELYDSPTGSWTRTAATVTRRSGHTATLLQDGRVLVVGGAPAGTSAFLSSELYTPAWGTFAPGPAMLTPRLDHVEALLPNGKVLLAGGVDPSNGTVLGSAEEFDPRPLSATTTEYKLPAAIDPEVLADRFTELWASVSRPSTLVAGKRYPLLVFLHGNHATCGIGTNPRHDNDCTYTNTGTCPSGWVPTPNHRGYDYVANELAGRGFIVVSINANRGINCAGGDATDAGLNLARGRLILRHLEELGRWNRGTSATPASVGVSLKGLLDFAQVGLLGHSRGGEGVRAAYEQYRDAGSPWPSRLVEPLVIRAAFEIGPVDGQTSRVLNANGTAWNVLLPMCDGDVSDLEGVRPFDRMTQNFTSANVGAKSTYTVWGANHNFYNTEWQESDSSGCTDHRALFTPDAIGSAEQRQTGMQSIVSFFMANVGTAASPELADLFDPERRVTFDSPVQRGYAPDPTVSKSLEEFTKPAGTSSSGVKNTLSRVTVTHDQLPEHDSTLRGATVRWSLPGTTTYFQVNFTNKGAGLDLRSYALLDFRVDRPKDPLNLASTTNFEVALVNADDSVSSLVALNAFADPVSGPVAGPYGNYHEMLSTARFPLASFSGADLASIRGVRFVFRSTPTGVVHLASVRASRSTLVGSAGVTTAAALAAQPSTQASVSATPSGLTPGARALAASAARVATGAIVSLRTTRDASNVEIQLSSATPFLPRGELLELELGGIVSSRSRHPDGGLGTVTFAVDKTLFDGLPNGQALRVRYAGGAGNVWELGVLDKQALDR
jgi:hypothetical protein